jgi:hypothetical protein
MRYQFIQEHRKQFTLSTLCRMLHVTCSGYYAWRQRPRNQRVQQDEQLSVSICTIYDQSQGRYGGAMVAHVCIKSYKHKVSGAAKSEWRG